ncbi:MAG: hypothetical protein JW772_02985 [Candidatus Diapherotrites archaeon]|nr:hypothetical protein [Candidatus Diapherotrites archaeon]
MGIVSKAIGRIASIVLDLDDTQLPQDQIAALNDFLAKHKFEAATKNLDDFLGMLKKKHLVDSITVSSAGEMIASSEGNGISDNFSSVALVEFVTKQLSKPDTILLKMPNGWHMIFPFMQKIYIVKAGTNLSTIELKALAKEIDAFLKSKGIKNKKNGKIIGKAF